VDCSRIKATVIPPIQKRIQEVYRRRVCRAKKVSNRKILEKKNNFYTIIFISEKFPMGIYIEVYRI
jgi:hypothetical protein